MEKEFFEIPDNKIRIEILLKKINRYLNNSITKESLIHYILQFAQFVPMESQDVIFTSVLETLEQIDFWDWDRLRVETEKIVQRILSKCENEYVFCGLGNEGCSSFRLLQMLPSQYRQDDYSLENILMKSDCPKNLIFIDDAVSSGKQVIEIFQEWLGIPEKKRKLGRKYVRELSEEAKKKLKTCRVYLGYLNFRTENKQYILSELNNLGIGQIEVVYLYEFHKIFGKKYSSDVKIQAIAKQCFEHVGKKIMFALYPLERGSKDEHAWTHEKLEYAALGYSDAQQMIVYVYNVPTYTLTALWKEVETSAFTWKPLFMRKKSCEEA